MSSQTVIAQIASVPARVDTLQLTVASLIDQVDQIFVGLNNYKEVPTFLQNDKIVTVLMDNSLGDAAKFYDVDQRKGYVLTCDDDLVYPQGYTGYMTSAVDRHKCVVSLLGKRYDNRPIQSYRRGYSYIKRALLSVAIDEEVHVGGTGCMAFHTDHLKVSIEDFKKPNMADLWLAKIAHEQGVKIMVIAHPKRYLTHVTYPERIWNTTGRLDGYQTEVINSFLQ